MKKGVLSFSSIIYLIIFLMLFFAGFGCNTEVVEQEEQEEADSVEETVNVEETESVEETENVTAQEEMNLTYAFGGPNQGAFAEANQWFCEEVSNRTNGKVEITIHWGGTLVSQPDTLPAVGKGVVDMGAAMGGPTITQNPYWSTLSLGGAGQDLWVLMQATYDMVNNNAMILTEMDSHNVVATHGYTPGTPILILKNEINSLDDLRGLRIRAGTPDENAAWSKLGVEPVQITPFELYESISRGVVDGALFTVAWADTLKLGEVAKYWYRFPGNLLGGDVTTVINKDVWNQFTPETQDIVKEIVEEYNDRYIQAVLELEAEVLDQVESELDVQYLLVTEEIDEAYMDAMMGARQEWFERWEKEGQDTKDIWEEYQGYVEKYQEELNSKGYPWER